MLYDVKSFNKIRNNQISTSPPSIIVHGREDVVLAVKACTSLGCPVCFMSAVGASAYGGVMWFYGLVKYAQECAGGVSVCGILDCEGRAGDVLAALRVGLSFIRFTGREDVFVRLVDIAQQYEATIFATRGRCFELPGCRISWENTASVRQNSACWGYSGVRR